MQTVTMKLRISFKLLIKFINHECLCNKDIRKNFNFVNIGVVPSSKSKRVFSWTCSLNWVEHKAIIMLTTWISKCVVGVLMCMLFSISTHKSFDLSTKPPLTLLISWAITLKRGLSWKTSSIMHDRISIKWDIYYYNLVGDCYIYRYIQR